MVIYAKINDGNPNKIMDFTGFSSYFNVPVTFGGSIDGTGTPFRFFNGTLSNIVVKIEE